MLHQLSFITTNPLQVYWSEKSGSAKPRIARVLYTLKQEQPNANKPSYSLIRQESPNLEFDAIAAGESVAKAFVVADGIKSCHLEYIWKESEDTQEKSAQEESSQKPEGKKEAPKKQASKKNSNWSGKKEEEKEDKTKMPLVPALVECTFTFWDTKKVRSTTYSFKIRIPSTIEHTRKDTSQQILEKLREFSTVMQAPPSRPTSIVQRPSQKGFMQL